MIEALERYCNKTLRFPGDIMSLYQDLTLPVLVDLDIPPTEANNPAKLLVWQEKKKSFLKKEQVLEDNLRDIFSVIWGQCSTSI